MIHNSYPDLPEVAFQPTSVDMPHVVIFAKTLIGKYDKEVLKAAMIAWRIESANGLKGVNGNYIGLQADCGVWQGLDMRYVKGTVVKKDSGGAMRRFIAFDDNGFEACYDYLCYKFKERGIYIGAEGIKNIHDLTNAYSVKWNGSQMPVTEQTYETFRSIYNSATKIFG